MLEMAFFKVNKSVMSQAEVYFVPPGLECDIFLQWKISLIPPVSFIHPMEKPEFAFSVEYRLFFQSRFLSPPAGLKGLM